TSSPTSSPTRQHRKKVISPRRSFLASARKSSRSFSRTAMPSSRRWRSYSMRSRPSRRDLLKAAAAAPLWTRQAQAAAEGVGPMKITKIEAVRFRSDLRLVPGIEPNWTWVRLHTDKGIVGLGESYPGYEAHRGALKELAGLIIGKDATQIE